MELGFCVEVRRYCSHAVGEPAGLNQVSAGVSLFAPPSGSTEDDAC
uniref:Uncharacterized protein n=1 Tax=uncultured alpha proteobacterium HF0010_30A23 TaxID=710802 RepID=E0XRM5_9PROT|nr:hypothetical protein [uncultured alpha proteobacterium HF0010_30A23]